jgi:hypothetical protein
MSHLPLGAAPAEEPCAQIGTDGFYERAQAECRAYAAQLHRIYSEAHDGMSLPCDLVVKDFPHDYGTYYEVVAKFDGADMAAVEAAYWLESHCPGVWDASARRALRLPDRTDDEP